VNDSCQSSADVKYIETVSPVNAYSQESVNLFFRSLVLITRSAVVWTVPHLAQIRSRVMNPRVVIVL
jgi:hypothetical protein